MERLAFLTALYSHKYAYMCVLLRVLPPNDHYSTANGAFMRTLTQFYALKYVQMRTK